MRAYWALAAGVVLWAIGRFFDEPIKQADLDEYTDVGRPRDRPPLQIPRSLAALPHLIEGRFNYRPGQPLVPSQSYKIDGLDHDILLTPDRERPGTGWILWVDGRFVPWRRLGLSTGLWAAPVIGHSFFGGLTWDQKWEVEGPMFRPGMSVQLRRDPVNQNDPGAMQVWDASGRRMAGYLPTFRGLRVHRYLKSGKTLEVFTVWSEIPPGNRKRVTAWVLMLREGQEIVPV